MIHNSNISILDVLASMPVFQGLSLERLREVERYCHVCEFEKDEFLFHEGDMPRAFYQLISGQVKLAVASSEGDEKVLAILCPVQSFGESELFGTLPYLSYAEAVQPTVVVQIGKEAIVRLVEQDSRFAMRMLQTLATRRSDLERDAAARRLQTCSARVMDYLLQLAGTRLSTTGSTTLELTATKQLIAARLDLTPETLSRTLRSLSDAGIISVRGRRVTLMKPITSQRTAALVAGRGMAVRQNRQALRLAA